MKHILLSLSAISSLASVVTAAVDTRYLGDKIVRFTISNAEELRSIKSNFQVWSHHDTISGEMIARFFQAVKPDNLITLGLSHKVLVEDLQQVVDRERLHMEANSYKLHEAIASGSHSADESCKLTAENVFADWQSYETLSAFMASLPGVTQLPSAGKTFLGRDINVYKFGNGRNGVLLHGGIHAREWISQATTTYVAHQFATNASYAKLLETFTFYVMPVVNPDGYAFTRDPNGNRYHRKNMQINIGNTCVGTDLNRNFDFHWVKGLSAPETKAIVDFVSNTKGIVGYIDFHAFSQYFMFANAYTCVGKVKDYDNLMAASDLAVNAIRKVHGSTFVNGDAFGSSVDYMYNILNVTYSYAVSSIVESGQEMTAGMAALWTYVADQLSAPRQTPKMARR
ncbi:hypothetical protein BDR26DRAFT_860309 [Obelidium mucronatum]|nr:hypothetical protein BDR26DRAFT_860309 [Obelidium mucronatum]